MSFNYVEDQYGVTRNGRPDESSHQDPKIDRERLGSQLSPKQRSHPVKLVKPERLIAVSGILDHMQVNRKNKIQFMSRTQEFLMERGETVIENLWLEVA